jgi:hypothetical protein
VSAAKFPAELLARHVTPCNLAAGSEAEIAATRRQRLVQNSTQACVALQACVRVQIVDATHVPDRNLPIGSRRRTTG